MRKGIASVKKNARIAETVDLSAHVRFRRRERVSGRRLVESVRETWPRGDPLGSQALNLYATLVTLGLLARFHLVRRCLRG
jgi:hypothetical protein